MQRRLPAPTVIPGISLCAVAALAGVARADDPTQDRRALRRTPVVEAVERASPAVVSIGTTRLVKQRYWDWDFLVKQRVQELKGLGSGVIVDPGGYVEIGRAHV